MNGKMKSSISKSNRSKDLKNTHTIPDIEKLMEEKLGIILNGSTLKDKKEAKKQLKLLERHFNDVSAKNENGHKYPEQRIYHSDDKPMDKKEIYKLIDSVEPEHGDYNMSFPEQAKENIKNQLDLSGVFVKEENEVS